MSERRNLAILGSYIAASLIVSLVIDFQLLGLPLLLLSLTWLAVSCVVVGTSLSGPLPARLVMAFALALLPVLLAMPFGDPDVYPSGEEPFAVVATHLYLAPGYLVLILIGVARSWTGRDRTRGQS